MRSHVAAIVLSLVGLSSLVQTPTPRGEIAHHSYQSQAIGGTQEFSVYTPPTYDAKRQEPYPVLYLLHGIDGDARSWVSDGGDMAQVLFRENSK